MVQACAEIDDAARRQDCFDAAAQRFDDTADSANPAASGSPVDSASSAESAPIPAESAPIPAESAPIPAESAPTLAESAKTVAETVPVPAATPPAVAEADAASIDPPPDASGAAAEPPPTPDDVADSMAPETEVATAIQEAPADGPLPQRPPAVPDQPSAITSTPVERPVFDIPRRFSATVTAIRELVRDRHLVVLDGKLLFEGEQVGRLAVGDPADVVRASSLFGRRYRITGPTRRSFDAMRIRCERLDLGAANQRKCDTMLGRQPR